MLPATGCTSFPGISMVEISIDAERLFFYNERKVISDLEVSSKIEMR